MNFIDKVRVFIAAGEGGDGCLSFLREKYMEFGGPNGGDGGNGGDVWLEASSRLTTLLDLKHRPHIEGQSGGNGKGSNKTGLYGEPIVIPVPAGTVVYKDGVLVADLHKVGQRYLAAKGGRGGRGNLSFKTRFNTAPRLIEKGAPGETVTLDLELKLIADIGLVGFPNAGKSSLLARVSAAKPKIANYPFTTLSPNLGVASHKHVHFVVADIPGLIEGAHQGKGLGADFLRHIERTRVLVHLVDPQGFGAVDAVKGVAKIESELIGFSRKLALKPRVLVVNKLDLPEGDAALKKLRAKYRSRKILGISAATGQGVTELLDRLLLELSKTETTEAFEPVARDERLVRIERGFDVRPLGGGRFELSGSFVERASAMLDATLPEAVDRFQRSLRRIGVDRALKRIGIKSGDIVRCGEFEFEWKDSPYKRLPHIKKDKRTRIGVGKK
jgi:GTPase